VLGKMKLSFLILVLIFAFLFTMIVPTSSMPAQRDARSFNGAVSNKNSGKLARINIAGNLNN